MADWKKGDIAELKSGGPEMTVEELHSGDKVECTWFYGDKLSSRIFDSEALKRPTPHQIG